MIFYFSGTGNSRWAAEKIAAKLGDTLVDMAADKMPGHSFVSGQVVGVVFPVYAWGPPQVVLDFVKKISANGAFVFGVCTCADNVGRTMAILDEALPLHSAYSLVMPNNYIIGRILGSDVEKRAAMALKVEQAEARLTEICADVRAGRKVFSVKIGHGVRLKSLINTLFNKFGRSTKPFYVNAACNGCGFCAAICPAKVITLQDRQPSWDKQCWLCLACLNRCPQKAIEYGGATRRRGRYYFDFDA